MTSSEIARLDKEYAEISDDSPNSFSESSIELPALPDRPSSTFSKTSAERKAIRAEKREARKEARAARREARRQRRAEIMQQLQAKRDERAAKRADAKSAREPRHTSRKQDSPDPEQLQIE